MSPLVREGFDEKLVGRGKGGALRLRLQPVAYIVGEAGPFVWLGEEAADAAGEVGAHRHARAAIGRDARRLVAGVDEQGSAVDLLHLQHQAGEIEGVARREGGGEAFLAGAEAARSEERRVGKEGVSECESRGWPN